MSLYLKRSVITGTNYQLKLGDKGSVLENLTRIATSINAKKFQEIYQAIETKFKTYYQPIKALDTQIWIKKEEIKDPNDLGHKTGVVKIESKIHFQTIDKTIEGCLYIGHPGDILPVFNPKRKSAEANTIDGDTKDLVKKWGLLGIRTNISITAGKMLFKFNPITAYAALIDQGRRMYNEINHNAHYTIELLPKEKLEGKDAEKYFLTIKELKNM